MIKIVETSMVKKKQLQLYIGVAALHKSSLHSTNKTYQFPYLSFTQQIWSVTVPHIT